MSGIKSKLTPTSGELVMLRELAGGPEYETSRACRTKALEGLRYRGLIRFNGVNRYDLTDAGKTVLQEAT